MNFPMTPAAEDVISDGMIYFALLAAQAAIATEPKQQLDAVLVSSERVSNQALECMDTNIKVELKAHIADATPENVVDAALETCSKLKKAFADAASSPGGSISPQKAEDISESWFRELRITYIKHVEDTLSKPDLAKARFNITLMLWRKCVQEKATDWSRLTDAADTVGKAAITSCSENRSNVKSALNYELRGRGIPASNSVPILDKLDSTMVDVATEIIISERAKQLPNRSK